MVWMYNSWLNHSLIEGYFGCFQFMAITYKAVGTTVQRVLCGAKFSFLWDKWPGVQLLGHKVNIG